MSAGVNGLTTTENDAKDTGRAVCESCGATADVVLADGSTWCLACHGSALRLGYDEDLGTLLHSPRVSADCEGTGRCGVES